MTFSKHNSALTLESLQNKPEGQYLERKGRDQKPTKIANELIVMLNAGGGTLAYGMADDGTIEDLRTLSSQELDAYRKIVHDFIRPPANIEVEEIYLPDGQLIFLFHVESDYERLFTREGNEPAQVTVDNIGRERYSRNPRITRVLAEMGYVRELNEGVPRIYSAMRESMLAEPQYKDIENTVTLTLHNKVTDHKETIHADTLQQIESHWAGLNKSQRQIINLLFENQEMRIPELRKHIKLTEQAIRYNLRNLIELNIIERLSYKARDPDALYRFLNK